MTVRLPPGPSTPRLLQGIYALVIPWRWMLRLKNRYGDAFTVNIPIFGRTVVISNPAEVREVFLAGPDMVDNLERNLGRVLGSGSLFALSGEEHRAQRRLLVPPFHGRRLAAYERIVEAETVRELASWPENTEFATLPSMMRITLNAILRAVFGAEGAEFDELRELLPRFVVLGSRLAVLPISETRWGRLNPWRRFRAMRREYDAIVARLIARAEDDPDLANRDDVLALLLQSRHDDGSRMNRGQIADQLLTLLTAGHETTATTLAWAIERLRRHPDVLRKLVDDQDAGGSAYREATIIEVQRSRPVIDMVGRQVTAEEFKLGRWTLPKGCPVLVSIALMHNNEFIFPNGRPFNPSRFLDAKPDLYEWIPFGGGVRRCLGAAFANMEMNVVLRTMLHDFTLVPTTEQGERRHSRGVANAPAKGGLAVVRRRGSKPAERSEALARRETEPEHVDVLIVGAGLSGIGAAHHIQSAFPGRSYTILEARDAIGGTWDLFRYPGVRSDSDMFTLGYRFRPWAQGKAIADGPSILRYVQDTAVEGGIDRHVRFGHRVTHAEWSSEDARWTITAIHDDHPVRLTASFLYVCGGYYHYDAGYIPDFPGIERFGGTVVHPQHWPADLDYDGKNVVVIGSGATAVTLVPAMAARAAHVTMLQRSPTYIVSMPGDDAIADRLRRMLGARGAYPIVRWKNVALQTLFYRLSRRRPDLVRSLIRKATARVLPPGYDIDTHFKPRYQPWDQRLCLVPDGDLFKAIRHGRVTVVTDRIAEFTGTGVALESGEVLDADVIVTATGLRLLAIGGIQLTVDGRDVKLPETMAYKGMMLSGVPNFAYTIGYTNASWTLKADLVSEYVVRLLRYMEAHGHARCVPANDDPAITRRPLLDFQAGYVLRSIDEFPKAGSRAPWLLSMSYPRDVLRLRHGRVNDGAMRFS